MIIPLDIEYTGEIGLDVSSNNSLVELGMDSTIRIVDAEEYTGSYIFTPSEETQTIQIDHLLAVQNIVICPIPNNYGKISKRGAVLIIT